MLKHQHSLLVREVSFHSSTQLFSETHSLCQWYITTIVAKGVSHMALPCGLLEATPSRNTRVNSHSVWRQGSTPLTCPPVLYTWDVSSCALHKGRWAIRPNTLIPSRISVLTYQLNSIHRGVRSGECLSHVALPCGLIEATPSRNTRVNSHSVWRQGSTPLTYPHVLSTWDIKI